MKIMHVFERGYLERNTTKVGSVLIFKGLRPEVNVEQSDVMGKLYVEPLKIRIPVINPIDILLRRSA